MKHILFAAIAALAGPVTAMAQEATYYNFNDLMVRDLDDEISAVWGSITGVSANGQFAVGSDWDLTYHSWIWKEDGTYETTHEQPAENLVLAINDEGTAVGSFWSPEAQKVVPGYRTSDGAWHTLPQPDYAQTANQEWKKGQYNDGALPYIPTAYFISNDGRHIGGWTYAAGGSDDDRPGYDAKLHGFFWHMNEAGEYELEDFTSMDLSTTQQGFRPYAMNNEGTIMAGLVQRDDNGLFEPAAIIDGELRVIIEATPGDFSEAAEKGTDEGSCFSVSGRNIYGYASFSKYNEDDVLDEGTSVLYSFRYNADTHQLDKLPGLCVKVANSKGQCLAIDPQDRALYIVGEDFKTLTAIDSPVAITDINAASDDFRVLGGLSQQYTDYGPVNTPIVIQYTDSHEVVGVRPLSALTHSSASYDLLGRVSTVHNAKGIRIEDGKKVIK